MIKNEHGKNTAQLLTEKKTKEKQKQKNWEKN